MNLVNMQEYANMKHVVHEYHYSELSRHEDQQLHPVQWQTGNIINTTWPKHLCTVGPAYGSHLPMVANLLMLTLQSTAALQPPLN